MIPSEHCKSNSLVPLIILAPLFGSVLQAPWANARPAESQAAGSPEARDRKVVAIILGENVYADDLQPPPTTAPAARPLSPDALSRHAHQQLARKIITPLRQQFIEENHLAPTAEELKQAADFIRRHEVEKDRERRARLAEIEARLQTVGNDLRAKESFLREKRGIEGILKSNREIEANAPAAKEKAAAQRDALQQELESVRAGGAERAETQEQIRKLEAQIKIFEWAAKDMPERLADWMLGPWMFHRALYRKYGGTVIWQQAGTEAVGAMRAWLEEHERAGHFKILDPDLREEFWRYYRRQDHPFQIKKADPFERPPWEEEPTSRPG